MTEKIAILSDIHANLEALEQALQYCDEHQVQNILVLGDVVGYGPNPNECVELLNKRGIPCLRGNHEEYLLNGDCGEQSNLCRQSTSITEKMLSHDNYGIIQNYKKDMQYKGAYFCHSKVERGEYAYLNDIGVISSAFPKKGIYFYGHTHRPSCVAVGGEQDKVIESEREIYFDNQSHVMINVGSVGQARYCETVCNFVVCEIEEETRWRCRFVFLPYDSYKTYKKVRNTLGESMANYLIREEERRNEYNALFNKSGDVE